MFGRIHADGDECGEHIDKPKAAAATYSELGRRIDELECDLLEVPTRRVDHEGFSKSDHTLFGARNGPFQHQEIVLHDTVVWEAAHGCDGLLGDVRFCRCISLVRAKADAVDLLVELGTVMVSVYGKKNMA